MVVVCAIALSALLAEIVRRAAVRWAVMDTPNERSSHSTPIPRGGGIAIAIVVVTGVLVGAIRGDLNWALALAIAVPGVAVATVGLVDDIRSLSPLVRLSVHIIGAVTGLFLLVRPGGVGAAVNVPEIPVAALLALMTIVGTVWFINLFNFMDGIDGLAATEAAFIAFGLGVLGHWASPTDFRLAATLIGAASLGFLVLNWPPAKLFMGDVGSGFLGLVLAIVSLAAVNAGVSVWAVGILPALFVVDATATLARRLVDRRSLVTAHRSHVYQKLAVRWRNHRSVTLLYMAVNLLWLLPLAALAAREVGIGPILTLVSYAPLGVAAWLLGAGVETTIAPPSANS